MVAFARVRFCGEMMPAGVKRAAAADGLDGVPNKKPAAQPDRIPFFSPPREPGDAAGGEMSLVMRQPDALGANAVDLTGEDSPDAQQNDEATISLSDDEDEDEDEDEEVEDAASPLESDEGNMSEDDLLSVADTAAASVAGGEEGGRISLSSDDGASSEDESERAVDEPMAPLPAHHGRAVRPPAGPAARGAPCHPRAGARGSHGRGEPNRGSAPLLVGQHK